jgi:putative endonuclease
MYYVGFTIDFSARLEMHNNCHKATFTAKHRPWVPKALFECGTSMAEAMKIEKFIKAQKSKKFIEMLIKGEAFSGILKLLVRVPKLRD